MKFVYSLRDRLTKFKIPPRSFDEIRVSTAILWQNLFTSVTNWCFRYSYVEIRNSFERPIGKISYSFVRPIGKICGQLIKFTTRFRDFNEIWNISLGNLLKFVFLNRIFHYAELSFSACDSTIPYTISKPAPQRASPPPPPETLNGTPVSKEDISCKNIYRNTIHLCLISITRILC